MGQIKKTDTHPTYKKLLKASAVAKEKNDCAPKAVSVVTRVPYEKVLEVMEKHGRKKKQGTYSFITRKTLHDLGWEMTRLDIRKYKRRFPKHHSELKYATSHSFRRFPEAWHDLPKKCLAFTAGHVFAVEDGQNIDWSVNNKLRIQGIYEIKPRWENIEDEK